METKEAKQSSEPGVFTIGGEVEVNGVLFRVQSVSPKALHLKTIRRLEQQELYRRKQIEKIVENAQSDIFRKALTQIRDHNGGPLEFGKCYDAVQQIAREVLEKVDGKKPVVGAQPQVGK